VLDTVIVSYMFSGLFSFLGFFAIAFLVARKEHSVEPLERLANFATIQASRFNQTSHEDIQLSEYTTFVKSACVSCATRELAQRALRQQLASLPREVADEIVDMALPERASVETARQNMSNTADKTGEVSMFLYYISTVYDKNIENAYRTCVLASGVRLVVGQIIVGHVTETKEEVTAFKPCHCGYLYCEKCPVVSQTVTQRPVYAQQTGTIEWHRNLNNMLARQAVEQVGSMQSERRIELDESVSKGWDTLSPITASSTKVNTPRSNVNLNDEQ
jgi:hypothetical protein